MDRRVKEKLKKIKKDTEEELRESTNLSNEINRIEEDIKRHFGINKVEDIIYSNANNVKQFMSMLRLPSPPDFRDFKKFKKYYHKVVKMTHTDRLKDKSIREKAIGTIQFRTITAIKNALQNGGKRKPHKKRKVYTGRRGGKYHLINGKKRYI